MKVVTRARRRSHKTRNEGLRWTAAHEVELRRLWGETAERGLREALGRTSQAIYRHAADLGLPPQGQGRATVNRLAARLGIDRESVVRLADECGVRLVALAPVSLCGHPRTLLHRAASPDPLAELLRQRDSRTATPASWGKAHGFAHATARRRLLRAGLLRNAGPHTAIRVPVGVHEELAARAPGPWCAAWRAAIRVPDADHPCAPWLLALVVFDLARGDAAAEWVTPTVSQPVAALGRSLAAPLVTTTNHRRAA